MELNDTSAKRINDVYSELAAITASDTHEISSAMTRTASIADSAGMEFGNTSAFLAKMIETTREAPENLGTAMKSIVARFQELKKDPSEIQPIDGEMIDANRVDTALKSIGVSLRDTGGEFRDLDDVFIDISGKWDGLTKSQQRYVATIAAGSRQQSRFLALMSDHERLMEMINAAENSEGAGDRQYEKTLEGLEAKLNKLKNQWDLFLMGLANAGIIKVAVGLLTALLTVVNKITGAFGSGLPKMALEIGVIVGLFKGIPKLYHKIADKKLFKFDEAAKEATKSTGKIRSTFSKLGKSIADILNKSIFTGVKSGVDKGTAYAEGKANKNALTKSDKSLSKVKASDIKDKQGLKKKLEKTRESHSVDIDLDTPKKRKSVKKGPIGAKIKRQLKKEVEPKKVFGASELSYKDPNANVFDKMREKASTTTRNARSKVGTTVEKIKTSATQTSNTKETGLFGKIKEFGNSAAKGTNSKTQGVFGGLKNSLGGLKGVGKATFGEILLFGSKALGVITKFPGPIAAISTGVTAAGFIIKKAYEKTTKARKEVNKTEQKNADDLVKTTSKNLKDLETQKTAYDDIQKSLSQTVHGSKEWKQALVDNNKQVIDMADRFPDLLGSLVKGADGSLSFTTEGLKAYQEELEKSKNLALQVQMMEQFQGLELESESAKEKYDDIINTRDQNVPGSTVEERRTAELKYKNTIQENDLKEDLIVTTNLTTEFNSDVADGFKDYAKSFLVSAQDEIDKYAEDLEDLSKSELKDAYSKAFNVDKDSIKLTKKEMASQLANAEFGNALNDEIERQIEAVGETTAIKMQKFFNGDSTLDFSTFKWKDAKKALMALDPNLSEEELKKYKDYYKELKEIIIKNQEEMGKEAQQFYREVNDLEARAHDSEAIKSFSVEQKARYSTSMMKANTIDPDFSKKLSDILLSDSGKDFDELSEKFNSINFDSAITGAKQLNDLVDDGNVKVRDMALAAKEAGEKFVGEGAQMSEFIGSQDYETVVGQLKEMSKATGKITADNIYDVAKGSAQLTTMLEDNEVSATAVARAITGIESGQITEATQSFMDMATQMGGIEDAAAKINKRIKEYTPGVDLGAGMEHIANMQEQIKTEFAEGRFGNIKSPYEELFGAGAWKKVEEAGPGGMAIIEQQLARVQELTEGGSSFNFWNELLGMSATGVVGGVDGPAIDFSAWEGKTYDQMRDYYANTMGTSKELADSMILDLVSRSTDGMAKFQEFQLDSLITGLNIGENSLITEEQVGMIAAATGQSLSNIRERIAANTPEGVSLEIVKVEDVIADPTKYQTQIQGLIDGLKGQIEGNEIRLDDLIKPFTDIGMSREQAAQLLEDFGAVKNGMAEINGQKVTITYEEDGKVKEFKDLADGTGPKKERTLAYAAQITNEEKVGDKDATIKYTANTDDVKGKLGKIKIPGKTLTVTPKLAATSLSVTLNINQVKKNIELEGGSGGTGKKKKAAGTGSKGMAKSEEVLVGEEGPELVETKNKAFFVGTKGPQFINLAKGDIVHSNPDTEKIVKQKTIKKHKAFRSGKYTTSTYWGNKGGSSYGGSSGGSSRGSSGGSKSNSSSTPKEEEKWENTFDKLYNLTQKINIELREKIKLDKAYKKEIKKTTSSAQVLYDIYKKQIKNLKDQQNLQNQLLSGRKSEASEVVSKNSAYQKYATYDSSTNSISIDWNALEALTDKDTGDKVSKYIKDLERIQKEVENAEDSLYDIEDKLDELEEAGKKEYKTLEDRVLAAVVDKYDKQIKKLEEVNNSIKDGNDKLLKSMQESLQLERQRKDNEEKEKEITDKEREIAYLQQDTSGANALEIFKLQEELTKSKEDFTDKLIDQKIDELKDQNQKASDERLRQIELAKAQLDQAKESGQLWEQIHELITTGVDATGKLLTGSELTSLLKVKDVFTGLSEFGQMEWLKELESQAKQAVMYLSQSRQLEKIGKTSGSITFTNAKGETLSGTIQSDGSVAVATSGGKNIYTDVYQNYDGSFKTLESSPGQFVADPKPTPPAPSRNTLTSDRIQGIAEAIWVWGSNTSGWGFDRTRWSRLDSKFGAGSGSTVQRYINDIAAGRKKRKKSWSSLKGYFYNRFETGGLADFTGPAWLDGTKSRPEIVLNQRDSQNFLQLTDILSNAMTGRSFSGNNSKGSTEINLEFKINVEQMSNDYDVEQMATKIKKIINDEARYRNINSINILR